MKDTELAWAAGFFDGEGCIGYYPQNRRMMVTVVQKDRRPLERFQEALGFGKIYGPAKSKSACYNWSVFSRDNVDKLFKLLVPFLSAPKQEQFHRAFIKYNNRAGKYRKEKVGYSN